MNDPRGTAVTPSLLPVMDGLYAIANTRPWTADRWSRFVTLLDDVGRFALLEETPEPAPVLAAPAPAAEPPQILLALNVATEEPPEPELVATPPAVAARTRPVRPLAPITVPCDPGCGLPFGQAEIAAHRRECEAVARHKEERGVRVVPSLASAAPLPAVPDSDFAEKRTANARAASEASWQRRNPPQLNGSDLGLTEHQERVLEALRKASGNQADANEVLGYERGSARVAAVISNLRQTKRLPGDVDVLLRGAKRPPRKAASS